MTTVVEICNRALSEMGTQSTIVALDEGSRRPTNAHCGITPSGNNFCELPRGDSRAGPLT